MDSTDDARELLSGVTALRLGLVDRPALVRALAVWGAHRDRPLARYLVDRGLVQGDHLAGLEAEVTRALKAHGGDSRLALDAAGPVAAELGGHLNPGSFDTIGSDDREADFDPVSQRTSPDSRGNQDGANDPAVTRRAPADDPDATVAAPPAPSRDAILAQIPPDYDPADDTVALAGSKPSGKESEAEAFSALRYRILRLHAKGGLGQVFVARDEELNRDVALKEIQGRYARDEESRLRFLIEAEVTGNLEHPGIVPVYGLGQYPDGRPYYAMRFVRGESLKEAIARFHQADTDADPGARALGLHRLLGQLVDVCNAMAYAHSRGVLHRDLKPGNVMIGAFGETLVVDWGLAKLKDVAEGKRDGNTGLIRPMSAGSTSQTLFGSAVGTPQYMSPEQAAGQLDQLGPATDIYSLGAILYTILVGNPAFLNRQLSVMLDKVRKGDFRPPRELNRTTHPALDAICRKAMALRPEARYSSARMLADDIEHWLADEPVSVYREPFAARVARWARRHKTAVVATAALLVTAVVSLAVYSILIKRERDRTERFYVLARRAVDEMLTQLGADDLANVPQMEPVRARMLREAKTFYEELRKARTGDPRAARDVALATLRLGEIETLLGDKEALPRHDDAVAKFRAMLKTAPESREAADDLARGLHARGLLHRKLNRLDDAQRDLSEALGLRRNLAARFPDSLDLRRARTDSLYHLAALHDRLGQVAEAKAEYNEAIASQKDLAAGRSSILDDRRLLGRYTNNLANLQSREKGDGRKEAKRLYARALEVQQDVVARDPVTAYYRYELAKTHGNLQIILASEGNFKESETHAVEDVRLSRRLTNDFPHVPDYRIKLATALSNLGELRLRLKQFDEAGGELDRAVALAEDLVVEHGDYRDYRSILAAALVNRGALRELTRHDPEAVADLLKARDALRPIVSRANPAAEDLFDLGTVYYKLAKVRARLDRADDALGDLDKAIGLHERARTLGRSGDGNVPLLWLDVSLQFDLLKRKGEYARCADLCERLPALRPDHPGSYLVAARMLAFLCADAAGKGDEPSAGERARTYAERAVKQLREADRRGFLKPEELNSPYYAKARDLLPDAFHDLDEAVKGQRRV